MFRITRSRSCNILCYRRPEGPFSIPRVMQYFFRLNHAVRELLHLQDPIRDCVALIERFSPEQDVIYSVPVKTWVMLLQWLWWCAFPSARISRMSPFIQHRLYASGLRQSSACNLLLLQSHIATLCSGHIVAADVALRSGTIALEDPMYVHDIENWLGSIYSFQSCRSPDWFFPLTTLPNFVSLREGLILEWKTACFNPEDFFDENGMQLFLRTSLRAIRPGQKRICSLSYVTLLFLGFLEVFVDRHNVTGNMKTMILEMFFEHLFSRIVIFGDADCSCYCMQSIFHIMGIICDAYDHTVWLLGRPIPIMFKTFSLTNGDCVYFCLPFCEEYLAFRGEIGAGWLANDMTRMLSFYGPEGRLPHVRGLIPFAGIGGLGNCPAWKIWWNLLSAFYPSSFPSCRPTSLAILSSRSLALSLLEQGAEANLSRLINCLDCTVFGESLDGSNFACRYVNFSNSVNMFMLVKSRFDARSCFQRRMRAFLERNIYNVSSASAVQEYREELILLLRLLPFCFSDFFMSACLSYQVYEMIDLLFGTEGLMRNATHFNATERQLREIVDLMVKLMLFAFGLNEHSPYWNVVRIRVLANMRILYSGGLVSAIQADNSDLGPV